MTLATSSSIEADPGDEQQDAEEDGLRARIAELEKRYDALRTNEGGKESKPVTVKVGGRLEIDWGTFTQDTANIAVYGNKKNGCQIRRARLSAGGDIHQVGQYHVEYEFANDADSQVASPGTLQSTQFKTCFLGVRELPLLNQVRVGFMKEPIGLEWNTSSRFIPFLERSIATMALIPKRNLGVGVSNWSRDERTTWAFGVYRPETPNEPPVRTLDHSGTAFTARVTRLPWYAPEAEGRGLFHIGMGYTVRGSDDHTLDLGACEESKFGPAIVDTGDISGIQYWQILAPEVAFVYGPFAIQSEFYHMAVNRGGLGSLGFNGYYSEVTYFLTGENRQFNTRAAKFGKVEPYEDFFRAGDRCGNVHTGKGAWEIAYRHAYVDLTSGPISGGRADCHTIGLNWYLNPNMRCMLNYVLTSATPGKGNPMSNSSLFLFRAAVWF